MSDLSGEDWGLLLVAETPTTAPGRRVTHPLGNQSRSWVYGVVGVLVLALGVVIWISLGGRDSLNARHEQADQESEIEKVASQYDDPIDRAAAVASYVISQQNKAESDRRQADHTDWVSRDPVVEPERASQLREANKAPAGPLTPKELYKRASPSVVRVNVRNARNNVFGMGSGFFVRDDATVVTNFHVIDCASSAEIVLEDGTQLPVLGILGIDEKSDVAILKVSRSVVSRSVKNGIRHLTLKNGIRHLTLGSDQLPPKGTKVYAIGAPEGLDNSLSDGLVSGHREIDGRTWIQLTAPISPGSSGSPVLSEDGLVVGIATMSRAEGQNLNFASPAAAATLLLVENPKLQKLSELLNEKKQVLNSVRETRWNGGVEAASKMLDALPKSFQELPDFWVLTGEICEWRFDWEAAITAYRAALNIDNDDSRNWYKMGWAYLCLPGGTYGEIRGQEWENGQYEAAAKAFQNGVKVNPVDDECWYGLGRSFKSLKRPKEAEAALRRCLALNAKNVEARKVLGVVLCELGEVDAGVGEYKAAMKIKVADANSGSAQLCNIGLGKFLQNNGRYTEAIEAFESALVWLDNNRQLELEIPFAGDLRKTCDERIRECRRLIRSRVVRPKNDVFTEIESDISKASQLSGDARKRDMRRILQRLEAMSDAEKQKVRYWETLSRLHAFEGLSQLAIDDAEMAIRIDDTDKDGWYALRFALWCARSPDLKRKLSVSRRIVEIDPDRTTPSDYVQLGEALLAVHDYLEASTAYKSALALDPNSSRAQDGLGDVSKALKRYKEAVGHYQMAIKFTSDENEQFGIYLGLADCCEKMQDYEGAIRAYEKSLEVKPEGIFNDIEAQIRDSISRLRGPAR